MKYKIISHNKINQEMFCLALLLNVAFWDAEQTDSAVMPSQT